MPSLQFIAPVALDRPLPLLSGSYSSSFWAKDWCSLKANPAITDRKKLRFNGGTLRVLAMSGNSSALKMNLNEYLVTLEKPLGIRFAVTANGKVIVHSLKKGANAEKSRIIMVGDTLNHRKMGFMRLRTLKMRGVFKF